MPLRRPSALSSAWRLARQVGAVGSLVVVPLWVCWSAPIFLLGAEFTWVYANEFGSRSVMRLSGGLPPPRRSTPPAR